MGPIDVQIAALAGDRRRGAAEIAGDLAALLVAVAELGRTSPAEAGAVFRRAVGSVVAGQASMAPVLNLANRACSIFEDCGGNWEAIRAQLLAAAEGRTRSRDALIASAPALRSRTGKLLVYSYSSTVFDAILACRDGGWMERVLCSEGRPEGEGLTMAGRLAAAGIAVTLYTDAALLSHIRDAACVWVGGDALCGEGLVNKVGTRALGELAKLHSIPLFALLTGDKVLPPELLGYHKLLPQEAAAFGVALGNGIEAVNEYFEFVPLELITAVLTENGLQSAEGVVAAASATRVSALFRDIVSG